jgi:PAS domain S-box-containing protein
MKPEELINLRQFCQDDATLAKLLQSLAVSIPDGAPGAHPDTHLAWLRHSPFVQALDGMVFVVDTSHTLKYASEASLTLTGYSPDTLINHPQVSLGSLILPEDWPQLKQALAQAMIDALPYRVEYRIRHRTGQPRWLLETGIGIHQPQGALIGFQGILTDITEKKRVEQALKLIQERYSLVVNAGNVGVCEWNLIHNSFHADAALRRMLGYQEQEALLSFRDLLELIHPDDRNRFTEKVRAYLSGIEPEFELEHRIWHRSQAMHWFRTYGVVIRSAQGKPERLVCISTDITRQREAELQIQSQATQLRETLNSSRLLGLIAARVRKSLDLDDILNTTVKEVHKVFHSDRVMIYCLDQLVAGGLVAHAWDTEWSVTEGMLSRYLRCLIHRPTESAPDKTPLNEYERYCQGKINVVNNVDSQTYSAEQLTTIHKMRIRSKLVVPILQGSHLWGLLVVHQCGRLRQWQISEIDLLEKLADQVGIAIQQAQLFQQVQQQAERERLLNEISSRLNTKLNPQHVLSDIVQLTGESLAVDRAYIFSTGAQRAEILAEWRAGPEIVSVSRLPSLIATLPKSVAPHHEFEQGRCFHAPDYAQVAPIPEGRLVIERAHTRSVLAAPVFIRGKLYGGLVLETTTRYRQFRQEEIQLLERISDQAAIALYNAQSYEYLEWQIRERTKELEEQKRISEAASQAKSQFLAVMSHELRTPLNSILGLSNLLGQEMFGELNEKQREYIACIQSSGEHLRDLIGDILDLAKVEAGRESLELKRVNIPDLVTYCLAMMRERAEEKQLRLTHDCAAEAQSCIADERRLRQMLLNLLSNAVKFTTEGEVSLQVRRQPQGITFTVKDTGIGISEAAQAKLFEAFYQVDSELSRHYEGTGLGLALTRQLARLHRGDVLVNSQVGVGSEFTIFLPDNPNQLTDQESDSCPSSPLHPSAADSMTTAAHGQVQTAGTTIPTGKRILIVEDDVKSALLLKDYLQVLGYDVEHLSTGDSFLLWVKQFKPQLVLMDVKLGDDVSGLDLLQVLRQDTSQQALPVVIISARALSGDREHFLSLGANDYISKPISIPSLELVLAKYL